MSKIIAIDFGLKRTGIAITDESKTFAFGLETVDSENLMTCLKKLVQEESVDTIVIGLPMSLSNDNTHVSQNVRLLKSAIENAINGVEVYLIDERFTSKMASQSMHTAGASRKQKRDKKIVDKVSATLILQSFLNQR